MATGRRSISRFKDVYYHFGADLNFRRFMPGVGSTADDFKGLSAESYMKWHSDLGVDQIAWIQMITQPGCTIFPSKIYPSMSGLDHGFYVECCQRAKAEGKYVLSYSCGGDNFRLRETNPEWFEATGLWVACLNATPFWDEHFQVVQEGLRLFPCDGFYFDMVFWDGGCRCGYCQAAYKDLYGEEMPSEHDSQRIRRFYVDSWSRWLSRAAGAVRDIRPDCELFMNHQWFQGRGVPLELQKSFDFAAIYVEFTKDSGKAEILRACNGQHTPVLCGDNYDPRNVAAILARRMRPSGYDAAIDYRMGEMLPLDCGPFVQVREEIEHDVSRVPEAKSLNERFHPFLRGRDWEGVEYYVRECEALNLTCREVTLLEDLTAQRASQYQLIVAPEIAYLPEGKGQVLRDWAASGGVLLANGIFGAMDANGNMLSDFTEGTLLGVKMVEGPLDVPAYLTSLEIGGREVDLDLPVDIGYAIKCEQLDAEPIGFGQVGAEKGVPLLWENRIGDGRVVYLAGRPYDSISSFHRTGAFREVLRRALSPLLKSRPFVTDIESPTEVWLNLQPAKGRLVLHVLSFDDQLCDKKMSIREDLIGGDALQVVYPDNQDPAIQGNTNGGYVVFKLPRLQGHVIMTADIDGQLESGQER
jgi:hypothetical protein